MAPKRYSEGQIVTRQELEQQGYDVANEVWCSLRQANITHNTTAIKLFLRQAPDQDDPDKFIVYLPVQERSLATRV